MSAHGEIRCRRVCITWPRPLSHLSKLYLILYLVLCGFMVLAEGDNDWPTYTHPEYTSEKCYLCPPGFYKSKDCKAIRGGGRPLWPTCIACHSSQFSQRWNEDGRCWDREHCKKNHTEIYNGGMYGPIKCACTGPTLEDETGTCVDGISLSKHTAKLKQLEMACEKRVKAARETVVVPPTKIVTVTQPPCTPPDVACPLCEVCPTIPTPKLPLELGIIIGVFIGIAISVLSFCIIHLYCKVKKTNLEKEEEVKKDAKLENGELPHNGAPKGKVDQPTSPSSRKRSSGTPEQLETFDNDSENTPLVPVPEPNDEKIKKEFEKKARKSDRHSDEFVAMNIEDETKRQEAAVIYHDESHNDEKALPIESTTAPVQPQYRAPTPAQPKQERDLLDEALRVIELNVTSLEEVDYILRHVLQLTAIKCEKLKNLHNLKITATIRAGFKEWCEEKNPTPQNLISLLMHHNRNSMAAEICDVLGIKVEQETRKDKEDDFDKIVKICEKILLAEHVKEFYRSDLEVNEKDAPFEEDRKTFVRRGLLNWKEKKGEDATPHKLLQLLADDPNLKNYADKISEEFYAVQGEIGEAVMRDDGAADSKDKAIPIEARNTRSGTVVERESSLSSEPQPQNLMIESQPSTSSNPQSSSAAEPRTFPTSAHPPESSSLSSPTGDLQQSNFTVPSSQTTNTKTVCDDEEPGTSAQGPTRRRRTSVQSDCERIEKEKESLPMEHIDQNKEGPDHDGKAGRFGETEGDATTFGKDDKRALKRAAKVVRKKVTSIEKADYIMRHVLQFSAIDCESIRKKNEDRPREVLRTAFKKWQQRQGKDASVENLLETLRKYDRNSLAQEIVQVLNRKEKGDVDACKKVENETDSNAIEDIDYADGEAGGDGKTEDDTTTFDEDDEPALKRGYVDKNLNNISNDVFSPGIEPTSQNGEVNEDIPFLKPRTQDNQS